MVQRKSPPKRVARKSPAKPRKSPARKSPALRSPRTPINKRAPLSPKVKMNRRGPTVHASYYKNGEMMQGQDGNMWQIKLVTKADGSKYKRWFKV